MRRKIGTVLDAEVIRRVKLMAAIQGKNISQVVEDALRLYLASRGHDQGSIVLATAGTMQASRRQIEQALSLDPYED